ncbi:hypothetical protein M3936_18895 [Sutcliffiella horikoshii]|uniref:hypothetical protein n=1 Tax=Sutcliffiella horikoshii TaxID=79883 RepID=UPI001CBF806A|nr:hypothetical protein [Sutcliffiella horikoshii]MCM3619642.1 hypothetical protein [Sutcliffiella horikoshii]UAL49810.1 hypothetical protein K7887_22080 [Sutcliffiella horikoshii]
MANSKVKTIKFNLDIPEEKSSYRFAQQQDNFSGWVKCLIQREARKKNIPKYKSGEDGVIRITL